MTTVMFPAKIDNEVAYFDLNDVLDILETDTKGCYIIVFKDGEQWRNAKLKKTVLNKFNRKEANNGGNRTGDFRKQ